MIALGFVVSPDHHQAGIFALGARVRLQRDAGEAGHFAQPAGQVGKDLLVTLGLSCRGKRMQPADFRPGDRHHLGRGVQFHGAGTQRDHAVG
jgi:hypothetical protein